MINSVSVDTLSTIDEGGKEMALNLIKGANFDGSLDRLELATE